MVEFSFQKALSLENFWTIHINIKPCIRPIVSTIFCEQS